MPADAQDTAALQQLRKIMLTAENITSDGETVFFTAENSERRIRLVNGNLIIQPGTYMVLTQVDDVYWETSDGIIALYYNRSGIVRKAVIANV